MLGISDTIWYFICGLVLIAHLITIILFAARGQRLKCIIAVAYIPVFLWLILNVPSLNISRSIELYFAAVSAIPCLVLPIGRAKNQSE